MLRPFSGFVPTSAFGARVVSPPKALLSSAVHEASLEDPCNFRRSVGRGAGPTLAAARAWLDDMAQRGALQAVSDSLIVHRAVRGDHSVIGVLGDVSIDAYADGAIKPHEGTIASNEQKMVGYMLLTRLFGNALVLAHRPNPAIVASLAAHSAAAADVEFEANDGTRHQLWIVAGSEAQAIADLMIGDLYIADGHHRIEAARSLASAEGRSGAWFPAGIYAEDQFDVWAFARGVRDAPLNGDALIAALSDAFDLVEIDVADGSVPRPPTAQTFGTQIAGRTFVLTIPADLISGDLHDQLDVSVLQKLILEPLFGIEDPRRDDRLETIADSGDAAHDPDQYDAWFLPYPTAASTVMAVADMERTMPPKSTYFLPKLPGGIVIRTLDE